MFQELGSCLGEQAQSMYARRPMMPSFLHSHCQILLAPVVQYKHKGSSNTAESIGNEALVHTSSDTLLCSNFPQTVYCAIIDMLLFWQLSLHLETATDGIERIADASTSNDRSLSREKGGDEAQDTLVILVWVQANKCVEGTQLEATVGNDAHQRDAKACIKPSWAHWA